MSAIRREGTILAAIDPARSNLPYGLATAELSNNQAQFANASGTEERQRTLLEKASPARPPSRLQNDAAGG